MIIKMKSLNLHDIPSILNTLICVLRIRGIIIDGRAIFSTGFFLFNTRITYIRRLGRYF